MGLRTKSISVKIGLLYIFLAIINMSIFTVIIYENQIDLITENTKFKVEEFTANLINSLNDFSDELRIKKRKRKYTIRKIDSEIKKVKRVEGFLIFTESGSIIHRSKPDFKITDVDLSNGIKAVTSVEFSGKPYFSIIDENKYIISFYVPLKIHSLVNTILFLKVPMEDFDENITTLYKTISIVIIFIAVFHIIFALFLFKLFVKPIKQLHGTSVEISEGRYEVRANIKQKDEIGELGEAFNSMADSIQEKIEVLQRYNEMMETELKIAGDVQKMIFPAIEKTEQYDYSIFFKAFGQVSGDYYDIFDLGQGRIGFLLVDASGHGVPAALITMVAKEQFKLYAPRISNPAALFQRVNTQITTILEEHEAQGFYFSAFYLILDKDRNISFCNAGHTKPILIRSKQQKLTVLTTTGFLVGISTDMNDLYETKSTTVESGDKIIMYTDGIVEPTDGNGEQFGWDRLIRSVKKSFVMSGKEILQTVVSDLSNHTDMDALKDDTTCIVIEIK